MPDLAVICPVTRQPCVMGCFNAECAERETERILALTDEQVMAEHLARYGGDQKLADKAVAMTRAGFEAVVGRTLRH